MGLLGAFTLVRLTLLLLTMVGLSSPLPAPYSQVSTAVHRITDAVIRDVVVDETSGTVVDSKDQRRIDQGSASDGAGSGFNVPAVLWISFGLAVGLYLTVGGMRLWRMTTAFALGIVSAFCAWVAIVNVVNAAGLSDLILTLISLGFFVIGSLGGLFKICRLAGLTALSIIGGMSVGVRLVLMREGLLLRSTALNWVVIAVCAVAGFVVTLLRQRIGIALSCTFTGTFLLSLGVDLIVNQQNGVSRGLRHLLDGNDAHVLALRGIPYKPPISTQITSSVSIALALVMAYIQFRFFSVYVEELNRGRPFTQDFAPIRSTRSADKLDMDTIRLPLQKPPPAYPSGNRFSL